MENRYERWARISLSGELFPREDALEVLTDPAIDILRLAAAAGDVRMAPLRAQGEGPPDQQHQERPLPRGLRLLRPVQGCPGPAAQVRHEGRGIHRPGGPRGQGARGVPVLHGGQRARTHSSGGGQARPDHPPHRPGGGDPDLSLGGPGGHREGEPVQTGRPGSAQPQSEHQPPAYREHRGAPIPTRTGSPPWKRRIKRDWRAAAE